MHKELSLYNYLGRESLSGPREPRRLYSTCLSISNSFKSFSSPYSVLVVSNFNNGGVNVELRVNRSLGLSGHVHRISHGLGVRHFSAGGGSGSGAESAGAFDHVADLVLVLREEIANEAFVDNLGTVELGQQQEDEESKPDPFPVGDEVENEAEEGLEHVEDAEDHPVG